MNTLTKGIGLFILVVTICVVWNWPRDKEMKGQEVAQKVASVSAVVTEEVVEAVTQAVQKRIEAQVDARIGAQVKKSLTGQSSTPIKQPTVQLQEEPKTQVSSRKRHQRFASTTTLPEGEERHIPEQSGPARYDEDDFADQAFSGKPVQVEPSNEEYRAAQKRLNENILSLEQVIANFK